MEESSRWFVLHLNPLPWTAPNVAIGRGKRPYPIVYKDAGLTAYQEAVKEALTAEGVTPAWPDGTPLEIEFFFWRRLDPYKTDADRIARKHEADATNMQKALEDALQGIVFGNDRDVKRITSIVVAQGQKVEPHIVIRVGPTCPWDGTFPAEVDLKIDEAIYGLDQPVPPEDLEDLF